MAEGEDEPRPKEFVSGYEIGQLHPINLELNKSDVRPVLSFRTDESESIGSSSVPQPVSGVALVQRDKSASRFNTIRDWSAFQLKCTKQVLSERLGSGTRTVDVELENRISNLRETHKKYLQLVSLTDNFMTQFRLVIDTQRSLAEHFAYMSIRSTELHTEFHYNSEAQKLIAKNGEALLSALYFFKSNIYTISAKTMEDTLLTVKNYETARLSYDAYRAELETALKAPPSSSTAAAKLDVKKAEFEKYKSNFEKLRKDLDIKLKLLETNKVSILTLYSIYCLMFSNHIKDEKVVLFTPNISICHSILC